MICRMLRAPISADDVGTLYEATRADSGFNEVLYVRHIWNDGVSVLIGAHEYRLNAEGVPTKIPVPDRPARLVELGYSPEIAGALPDDVTR